MWDTQHGPLTQSQPGSHLCPALQAGSRTSKRKSVRQLASWPEAERIDADGLPHVGSVLYPGQSWHCTEDADYR